MYDDKTIQRAQMSCNNNITLAEKGLLLCKYETTKTHLDFIDGNTGEKMTVKKIVSSKSDLKTEYCCRDAFNIKMKSIAETLVIELLDYPTLNLL